jgi:hypothetical protein
MVSAFLGFSKAVAFSKWPSVDGANNVLRAHCQKEKKNEEKCKEGQGSQAHCT